MRRNTALAGLVLAVALALLAIAPAAAADGDTNNQTVAVEVSLPGTTAENVSLGSTDRTTVRQRVATALDVSANRVVFRDRGDTTTVELRTAGVSPDALATALTDAGASIDAAAVYSGISTQSRQQVERAIGLRLDALSAYNGTVVDTRATGVTVRVTPEPPESVLRALVQRGAVRFTAHRPAGDSVTLLSNGDFASIGGVRDRSGLFSIPATLSDRAAERFADRLVDLGFTSKGINACESQDPTEPEGYCLVQSLDDESVYAAGISPGLAQAIENGDFAAQAQFRLVASDEQTATRTRLALVAGPLPVNGSVERVTAAGTHATATPDVTATATPGTTATPTTTPGDSGPGFTALVALLALLGAAGWSRSH
jgi:PGF-CTERM protein